MKAVIERTMFFFKDGEREAISLNNQFFPIAVLLNRLLCEKYNGKKIKFINIFFSTQDTYDLYPQLPQHYTHNYGGVISYNDVFNLSAFNNMRGDEQKKSIWKRVYEILSEISSAINNSNLSEACEYAYIRGIELGLNPDYRMVDKEIVLNGQQMRASIWVNFHKDGMYSKLTLEKDGNIYFEKPIDQTTHGVEFFLEMYKAIEVRGNDIVIKGRKDVDYLPLVIPIDKGIVSKT